MNYDEFKKARGMIDPNPRVGASQAAVEQPKPAATGGKPPAKPADPPKPEKPATPGNTPATGGETATPKSLSEMSKDELLEFAGQRNIYDKSMIDLEQPALAIKIRGIIRELIVKAGLKTADEVDALDESEGLALFDTLPKGK